MTNQGCREHHVYEIFHIDQMGQGVSSVTNVALPRVKPDPLVKDLPGDKPEAEIAVPPISDIHVAETE
jgi:hypothetical protein